MEDRRGVGLGRPTMVGGGIGAVVFLVVALLMGADPGELLNMVVGQNSGPVGQSTPAQTTSGAPCDFAQAYVLAHEVGHHVQSLLGILPQMTKAQAGMSRTEASQLLVRLELQADCYAGIWAHYADSARNLLEQGDIEEAMNAASAVGDDRLQKQSQGYVVPDSFTHGTSAQRQHWFRAGLEYGSLKMCDTFAAGSL